MPDITNGERWQRQSLAGFKLPAHGPSFNCPVTPYLHGVITGHRKQETWSLRHIRFNCKVRKRSRAGSQVPHRRRLTN